MTKRLNDWFIYLASPYSKYPDGAEKAWEIVSDNAGLLIKNKVPVFCPIAHCHPISIYGKVPEQYDIWLPADEPFVRLASALCILKMDGWDKSFGVNWEKELSQELGKPVFFMEPGIIPETLTEWVNGIRRN